MPSLFSLIRSDLRAKPKWMYGATTSRALTKTLFTDGGIFGGCVIGRGAAFGKELVFVHSNGSVTNGDVRGGSHVYIEHQVTIGAERSRSQLLGDGVFIGAGAKIVGPVRIGSDVRIGAKGSAE